MPVWLLKLYNPKVDFNDLRWSQKLVIPVIKERTQDSPDIVQPSPTVPPKRFEGNRVVGKSWTNSCYPLLFIVLIITFFLHMKPHAQNLRHKFKTVFAFIR
jgi:hypothetical protein